MTGINPQFDKGILVTSASVECLTSLMFFLDKGADPNEVDVRNRTALLESSRLGNIEMVGVLLERRADPNKASKHGLTALMGAVINGHVEILEKLLKSGADPNIKTQQGLRALDIAEQSKHPECVAILKKYQNHGHEDL